MSTENIEDRFHTDTMEGVDAVLNRMVKATGMDLGLGWGDALDVSKDTIKTWRRRGQVPMKFLTGFAEKYNVSLDYLRHGKEFQAPGVITVVGGGQKKPLPLDVATLELAIEYVRNRERLEKKTLSASAFANAVRLAYEISLEESKR